MKKNLNCANVSSFKNDPLYKSVFVQKHFSAKVTLPAKVSLRASLTPYRLGIVG